jgi:hypothetical protein
MPTFEAAGRVLNNLISIQNPIPVVVEPAANLFGGDAAALGSPGDQNTGTMDGAYQLFVPAALYRSLGEPIPFDLTTLPTTRATALRRHGDLCERRRPPLVLVRPGGGRAIGRGPRLAGRLPSPRRCTR